MMDSGLTVNFHLTKNCNFRCGFCFAHFRQSTHLEYQNSASIVQELRNFGFRKINFAGGEPLLYRNFNLLLKYSKKIGFITSIITNGSRIDQNWVKDIAPHLDILGVSCDSGNRETLQLLGRGNGTSVDHTKRVFEWIDEECIKSGARIYKKLNSVVTKLNWKENMSDFVKSLNIHRWKVFQVLRIEGENEMNFSDYQISNEEYSFFLKTHSGLPKYGVKIIAEDNSLMTNSYLMVNPSGRFYDNNSGRYYESDPILEVGVEKALQQIHFSKENFTQRNGFYSI
ncbi:viperin family antiviral radical SAM protein [Leptospira levettii]|nr:viperin family antiviral radical SAM protein [Leptospira levettii]